MNRRFLLLTCVLIFTGVACSPNHDQPTSQPQPSPAASPKPATGAARVSSSITSQRAASPVTQPTLLGDWSPDTEMESTPIRMDASTIYTPWGGRPQNRIFPNELLPACFERTLVIDSSSNTDIDWIFTGNRAGLTIHISDGAVTVQHRYYDSPALNEIATGNLPKNPEWRAPTSQCSYDGNLLAVTVRADHKLGLTVLLNGKVVHHQQWVDDLSRHQLRLINAYGELRGQWLQPSAKRVTVRIDPATKHQTMLGFGGTATPTAYALLSDEGKQRWWQLVANYNLLIQREYPMGNQLHPEMDNWDHLADAVPHYYGDNFPNSEISDFVYLRKLRDLGGHVFFEFWALPRWMNRDPEKYAAAIVKYCQVSQEKTGHPPDIVGIQNELEQRPELWQAMTLTLRKALDAAGFSAVKIHMSDGGAISATFRRLPAFTEKKEVWDTIDYAASHIYEFQHYFNEPDSYDDQFIRWRKAIGDKLFLSTELCVNDVHYQDDSYRLALSMGELYHKNLVLTDAVAVCYCWTLINVTQPTYGQTRSLMVPDETHGGMPVASSNQLRVFGAFSRRIHEGMTRLDASSDDPDVLVTAFAGTDGRATLVAVNRSSRPVVLTLNWPDTKLTDAELTDPYHENAVMKEMPKENRIEPGAILTLSNVKLFEPK